MVTLRFYAKSGLEEVDPSTYNYKDALQQMMDIEKNLGSDSTSAFFSKWQSIDRRSVSNKNLPRIPADDGTR